MDEAHCTPPPAREEEGADARLLLGCEGVALRAGMGCGATSGVPPSNLTVLPERGSKRSCCSSVRPRFMVGEEPSRLHVMAAKPPAAPSEADINHGRPSSPKRWKHAAMPPAAKR